MAQNKERTTISLSADSMEFIRSDRWANASLAVDTIVRRYRLMMREPINVLSGDQLKWLGKSISRYDAPVLDAISARAALSKSFESEPVWPAFVIDMQALLEHSTSQEAMLIIDRAEATMVK